MNQQNQSSQTRQLSETAESGPLDAATTVSSRSRNLCDARLRKHADYQRVYKATRKQFSSSMTWFLATRDANATTGARIPVGDTPRVGLTVGKVLGKAHERNRIKRRMREAVRLHLDVLPSGIDLILHPRRMVMDMDFGKLQAEILRIFRQAAGKPHHLAAAKQTTAS